MENNNENSLSNNQSRNNVQYTEDKSTGLLGVLVFFIVMFIAMIVIAHFKA